MAVNYSARKICWQLNVARSIMFDSVYYHHKKLSAEKMFNEGLALSEHLLEKVARDYNDILNLRDDYFNSNSLEIILQLLGDESTLSADALILLKDIRNRSLWKRVASISPNTLVSVDRDFKLEKYDSFLDRVITPLDIEEQNEFFSLIKKEISNVSNKLDISIYTDKLYFAFIESTPSSDDYSDWGSVLIEQGDGLYKRASDIFKDEPWMQGRNNKQKEYFLISNISERNIAYLALEKVLFYCEQKFVLNIEAVNCAKYSAKDIFALKHKLVFKGYYDDAIELVTNEMIETIATKAKIGAIIDKFNTFQGRNGKRVTRESLLAFLKQFLTYTTDEVKYKSLLDGLVSILNETNYINREEFIKLANDVLTKVNHGNSDFSIIKLIKIGGSRDSSNSWAYYFSDLEGKLNVLDIKTALIIDDDKPLVFFDDGAYSGSQIISVFQELMGMPIENRTTNETHVEELCEDEKTKLKNSRIVLAYLFFNESKEDRIVKELSNLGIQNVEIHYAASLNTKIFNIHRLFTSTDQCALVKEALSEIGHDILQSKKMYQDGQYKERWDEERISRSSLGYEDAQQMVVFERNIPTYSLTAFWQGGEYKGYEWRSLFERTEKD
jgi:hypothetical protein